MEKRFGFFDQISEEERNKYLVPQKEPSPDEQKIAHYLTSGITLIVVPGVSKDLIDMNNIIGPAHILTDGEWVWTSDVPYYVTKYHIALPADFIQYMESKMWQIKPLSAERIESMANKFL